MPVACRPQNTHQKFNESVHFILAHISIRHHSSTIRVLSVFSFLFLPPSPFPSAFRCVSYNINTQLKSKLEWRVIETAFLRYNVFGVALFHKSTSSISLIEKISFSLPFIIIFLCCGAAIRQAALRQKKVNKKSIVYGGAEYVLYRFNLILMCE